jgi:ribosome-binding protein aMBF1 (putative translation factor)
MVTGEQIKAARLLLGWDLPTLARSASVEEPVVESIEAGADEPIDARKLIEQTLEAAGIEFPDGETVRLKPAS